MTPSTIRNNAKKTGIKIIVLLIWLLLWQAAYFFVSIDLLIPSPLSVTHALIALSVTPDFWISAGASLYRIMLGYFWGIIFGTLTAVITSIAPKAHTFLFPAISIIKATPIVSFIILALVWLKTDQIPVFISFLMVLPIVWSNVSEGIKNTPMDLLQVAQVFHFKKIKTMKKIYLPCVLPYFTASATSSLGLAWKSGIAAEVLCSPHYSIGSALYQAKVYLETDQLFAWTFIVILLSMLLENLTKYLLTHRRIRKWN